VERERERERISERERERERRRERERERERERAFKSIQESQLRTFHSFSVCLTYPSPSHTLTRSLTQGVTFLVEQPVHHVDTSTA
jgi:hypothetical protein